jgi:hypothetical protein
MAEVVFGEGADVGRAGGRAVVEDGSGAVRSGEFEIVWGTCRDGDVSGARGTGWNRNWSDTEEMLSTATAQ